MEVYRIQQVENDHKLTLEKLPFEEGDEVEVIVRPRRQTQHGAYPLRGKPIRYIEPFESVAKDD